MRRYLFGTGMILSVIMLLWLPLPTAAAADVCVRVRVTVANTSESASINVYARIGDWKLPPVGPEYGRGAQVTIGPEQSRTLSADTRIEQDQVANVWWGVISDNWDDTEIDYDSVQFVIGDCDSGTTSQPTIDPVIAEELERGVRRLFDLGLVIAEQPNGDLHYYTPQGCLVGSSLKATLDNAVLGSRALIESVAGCGGYRVDIWSLGFPACQLQANIYGPGFERVYEFQRNPSHVTCQVP